MPHRASHSEYQSQSATGQTKLLTCQTIDLLIYFRPIIGQNK
jgi:hypothetical protein